MRTSPFATTLAFRLGQIDTLARFWLASPALYTPEMRGSLGLRWLRRIWAQYREDRGIEVGATLFNADCTAERIAFFALLASAIPTREKLLTGALRAAKKIDILPLADEARQAEEIIADSGPMLARVRQLMDPAKLSPDPVLRLSALIDCCRYTSEVSQDAHGASAKTPCWTINLLSAARGFGLTATPLPLPGLVRRRLFRADSDREGQRLDIEDILLEALHELAVDIAVIPRANAAFAQEFTNLRRNSRGPLAWLTLFALGGLTPAQLARALPSTKAGAAKLLRQLEDHHMVRSQGAFAPYLPTIRFPIAFPAWAAPQSGQNTDSVSEDCS